MPFSTSRLILRKLHESDSDALFKAYASDPEVTANTSWSTHSSVQETKLFVQGCLEKWKKSEEYNLCICLKESSQKPVGMFKIKESSKTVNIGYVLAKSYWNQGYMSEVIKKLSHFLLSLPNIDEIQAFTDPDNAASQKVLQKSGFQYSRTLKKNIIRPQLSSEPRDSLVYYLRK